MSHLIFLLLGVVSAKFLHIERSAPINKTTDLNRPPTLEIDGDGVSNVGPGAPWRPPPRMQQKSITQSMYPRTASMNLDLPPKQRWVELITQYRDEILPYYVDWRNVLNRHIEIDQTSWLAVLKANINSEYLEEMQSIADTLNHPDASFDSILLLSSIYELGSPVLCSEILAATKDGSVLHGRNLDFKIITPLIEVTHFRKGVPSFSSPMYLGTVGIHTGIKHGHWSYGTNTRLSIDDLPMNTLARAKQGAWTQSILARTLFDSNYEYDYVVAKFRDSLLIRSAYYIIGGAGPFQGAVITRWWDPSFRHMEELSSTGKWWVLQGNADTYLPPVPFGPKQLKENSALHTMSTLDQSMVSPSTLVGIMHKPPLLLPSNVVLFVMSAKAGKFCSILGKQIKNDDTSVNCPMTNWTDPLPIVKEAWTRWKP